MSQQERASVIALITSVALNAYVAARLGRLYANGALGGDDALQVWARAVVWVFPAAIVLTVLLHVVFTVTSDDRSENGLVDERDRQYRLRGIAITLTSVGIGFTAMVVAFAFGWEAVAGLTVLYASVALGDLIGNSVRLASYRMGA